MQVVDAADSMTYDAHDVDDAIKLGLVTLEEMMEIPLIADSARQVRQRFGDLDNGMLRKSIVHQLIDNQVGDVVRTSGQRLAESEYRTGTRFA